MSGPSLPEPQATHVKPVAASKDTTEVRAGEELDLTVLDNYLRQRLPEVSQFNPSFAIDLQQFPGGHSNLTYLVSYGDQQFVLRRPPLGPVAPTAHDMPREYRLLSVINPHFPLAPRPVLLCADASIIGAPFYLMERRRGFIVRSKLPGQFDDPALRRRVSESVVDTLVALHEVDIQATDIVQIGKPAGFVTRQVRGWADRWQRAQTGELAEMEQLILWLVDRIPSETADVPTIVHNDFKLDNIMLDVADPARVVAVLDWEMCTVGDPLVDFGLLLCYWTMSGGASVAGKAGNNSLRAVTHGPGWLTREELIERYQVRTGRDVSRIVFYETFARFKVAVVIQQIYFRYVLGQTQDERFRNLDLLVRELAQEAIALAQRSEA